MMATEIHNGKRPHEGGAEPETRSPMRIAALGKEKRPLRGVGPKMLSSAGLVIDIMPLTGAPVNRLSPMARLLGWGYGT